MTATQPARTRGRIWFEALAGHDSTLRSCIPSLLVADVTLDGLKARLLAVVPDPNSRFPRARNGEVGIEEGWNLAKQIRDLIRTDSATDKRAIVAIVDVPSQAYGRREESLGIFLAAGAATDAFVSARLVGHPVISLIVGHAISGGFLTHGAQANRLIAFHDPGVTVHAMAKKAAAVVTRRTVQELDELAAIVIPLSYKIDDYAKLGMLHKLIEEINPDSPTSEQIARVKAEVLAAIADARSGPRDLSVRLESEGARTNRRATQEVRRRLAEQWHE
jgi:biotin-independent malonate decarboxylase gamma subunit